MELHKMLFQIFVMGFIIMYFLQIPANPRRGVSDDDQKQTNSFIYDNETMHTI
jgi:hypothetical protein